MKLSIYSLKKILFQGEAELLNCKTMAGEITILDNHESLIAVLTAGIIKIMEKDPQSDSPSSEKFNGVRRFFEIKSGFVEVCGDNKVNCLVNQ